jgi:hypothetical protein
MKRLTLAALVLLWASGALAGGNPDVIAYVDFDPPNRVHECSPVPYETFSAYICLGDLDEGVMAVSFALNDILAEYPGCIAAATLIKMFPGDLVIPCDTWTTTGCTVWSSECLPGPDEPAVRLDLFYLGGSCCIEILDHAWYTREVVDCSEPEGIDTYCVLSHGSVGGALCLDGDCPSPVEDGTWGMVKSFYR